MKRVVLLLIVAVGCTRVESGKGGSSGGTVKRGDPWVALNAELAKQPDAAVVRRVIAQLNAELDQQQVALPKFDAAALEALAVKLNASAEEAKDWGAANFTSTDANHLAESVWFQHVARSLDVDDAPVPVKAKAAFDWTVRQVYARPWMIEKQPLPPLPPQAVLKRGYGNGIDRETVFLALARQLGLDAVLIAPPGAQNKPRMDKTPRGAFWALGVRDGNDVLLFDPWLGVPLPKLSEAKADPKKILDIIDTKSGVRAEDIKDSTTYTTAPIPAYSPRMKLLEEKTGVPLTATVTPPMYAPAAEVDRFTRPHGLAYYLPRDQGGYEVTGTAQAPTLYQFANEREPRQPALAPAPAALKNELARARFRTIAADMYKGMIADATADERIQQGQFNDAIRQLSDLDKKLSALKDSLRAQSEAVRQWYQTANDAYDKSTPEADRDAQVWNTTGLAAVNGSIADLAANDIAYLLALCKHEQAERMQMRLRKGGSPVQAAADWAVAKDAWARYLGSGDFTAAHPGRNDHARKLSERAAMLAANPDEGK